MEYVKLNMVYGVQCENKKIFAQGLPGPISRTFWAKCYNTGLIQLELIFLEMVKYDSLACLN